MFYFYNYIRTPLGFLSFTLHQAVHAERWFSVSQDYSVSELVFSKCN